MKEIPLHPIAFDWFRKVSATDEYRLKFYLNQGETPSISSALTMIDETKTPAFMRKVARFAALHSRFQHLIGQQGVETDELDIACTSLYETARARFMAPAEILAAEGIITGPNSLDILRGIRAVIKPIIRGSEDFFETDEITASVEDFFNNHSRRALYMETVDPLDFVKQQLEKRAGEYHERGRLFLIAEMFKGYKRLKALNKKASSMQKTI